MSPKQHRAESDRPLRIFHFTPAASFDRKFLFHPTLHDAELEVHFFAVGRSGYLVDKSPISAIFREYGRALRILVQGIGNINGQSIAYCHSTIYSLPALIICRLLGVGQVLYFNHGVPYIGYRGWIRWVLKTIDRLNVMIAHHFLTISPSMVTYLKPEHANSPFKHSTFLGSSSGLRATDFADQAVVRARPKSHGRPVRFLYAGRLQERKGVFVLLEGWRRHAAMFPFDELWLCGFSAEEFGQLRRWADLPNVVVHGYVTDMASIYSQVDVVVCPSFHEGFGYTLLEGAARGCCIISSDVPGPDVMFTPWMQGQRFIAGDSHSLSQAMSRVREAPLSLAIAKRLSYRSALRFEMRNISYPHFANQEKYF